MMIFYSVFFIGKHIFEVLTRNGSLSEGWHYKIPTSMRKAAGPTHNLNKDMS